MIKVLVRQGLPVVLAVGLLGYVLKDVPVAQLSGQFRRADYRWLLLVGVIIGSYYVTRAARWQLTLQAIGYQPSLFRATVALLAGTMMSLVVPGAGEIVRCGTLQRTDDVPLAQGFGSVVAERVIDLLMLGGLIALTFLLEFNRVGRYITALIAPRVDRVMPAGQPGLLLVSTLFIVITLLGLGYWLLSNQAFRQHRFTRRAEQIGRDVGNGFLGIYRLKRPAFFVWLTLVSYLLSFLITYVLFFASSQTMRLPPTAALTILTVSSLGGLAVPTQGGLGTYHFLVSRVLMLYGLSETESVIIATFLHAGQTAFSLLFSSLSLLVVPVLVAAKHRHQTFVE